MGLCPPEDCEEQNMTLKQNKLQDTNKTTGHKTEKNSSTVKSWKSVEKNQGNENQVKRKEKDDLEKLNSINLYWRLEEKLSMN